MFEKSQKIYGSARHLSRVAAVQAVYQMEQNPEDRQDVVFQFLNSRFNEDVKGTTEPDINFFKDITNFLANDLSVFDQKITEQLAEQWKIERLPSLSRSILRCALYELTNTPSVPTSVIINEYLEVAKSFLEKKDVSFIHGIIDALAKKIR
ncbi:MAG: transcription antitermination factor NusB [Proteobacteria bacterium]|nr:transcription antitermination factor NusB [Pseudomonadota bacterium]